MPKVSLRDGDLDPATLTVPDGGMLVVWCPTLAPDLAVARSASNESERVARLRRPEDRARSLTAAWLLRQVAGAALGVDPRDVAVDRTCRCGRAHGRPSVTSAGAAGLESSIDVSVTHAGAFVGVACTRTRTGRVGLDVEPSVSFAGERAEEVLAAAASTSSLTWARSGTDVGLAAGRLWVCKEAVLKATGHGLTQDPRGLSLDPASGQLTGWPFPERVTSAHLLDVDPDCEHLGAIALVEPAGSLAEPGAVRRAAPPVRVLRMPDCV